MEAILSDIEQRGDRRGKVAAGIGFLLIVALLIIPVFFYQNPPPGQPGILVNLGFVDMGQGDENAAAPSQPEDTPEPVVPTPAPADPTPPPPPPPATKPEPKPIERDVVVTEDPAAVELRKQKAREEAARQAEQRRQQEAADAERRRQQAEADARRRQEAAEAAERQRRADEAAAAAEAERRRKAEADALKGQLGGSFGSGSGNGNTGKPGNQGVDNGDPNADRLEGISTGNGRVSGGLGGRGVMASPPVRENSQVSGTVVIEVCVNPEGQITKASYTQNGSSTADPTLVAAAVSNAKKWRFEPNPMAPAEQCGRISYNFKVQ